MSATLGRHVLVRQWTHTLIAGTTITALFTGIQLASARPGADPWHEALELLTEGLPHLPALAIFFGTWAALARLHREGSLLAIPALGVPLRRVGLYLVLGAVPFACIAVGLEVFPLRVADEELPERPALHPLPLAGGGFFFRSRAPGSSQAQGAALLASERRVLLGPSPLPPAGSSPRQLRLRVREEWRFEQGSVEVLRHDAHELWVGYALSAPRSILWGDDARVLDLSTIQRWLAEEPARPDLRFARDIRLRGGLRVLVPLLLGLASWLRPTKRALLPRTALPLLPIAGYAALETWCGALGVVGRAPSSLCAFGPGVLFACLGLVGLWCCDRVARS